MGQGDACIASLEDFWRKPRQAHCVAGQAMSNDKSIQFLRLNRNDPTARLFNPFSKLDQFLLLILTLLMLLGPPVLWGLLGKFIRPVISSNTLMIWVIPSLYTFLSVFLAFLITQRYQAFQDYKRDRLRLAGLLRCLALEAANALQSLSTLRVQYRDVPNSAQQRLDFVKSHTAALALLNQPFRFHEIAMLLDRQTFQVLMEHSMRMQAAAIHAGNDLTSAEQNLQHERSGIQNAAWNTEFEEAWQSLGPILNAEIGINQILLDQINDRLFLLHQERVRVNASDDAHQTVEATANGANLMDPSNKERLEKALEVAVDNRKFEIDLLWRRSLVFWGFVAALSVSIGSVRTISPNLTIIMSAMGALFSFIWSLVNRASKSWQESWETKAKRIFESLYDNPDMYKRLKEENQEKVFPLLRPAEFSLSRLLMALSDYSVFFWIGLTAYLVSNKWIPPTSVKENAAILTFLSFTVLYALYVL